MKKKLGDLKDIQYTGGVIVPRVEAKANELSVGTIKVLMPSAIASGEINKSETKEIELKKEVDESKLTQEGDIILKLSAPYDAVHITKEDCGLLVTSFCAIIRNNNKEISSDYMTAFFNSQAYLNQVKGLVSGSSVPMLAIAKIKDVEIKILNADEQNEVAEYFKCIRNKERLYKQIIDLENEKLDSILGGRE